MTSAQRTHVSDPAVVDATNSPISSGIPGKQHLATSHAKSQPQSCHCADSKQSAVDKMAIDLDLVGQYPQPAPVASKAIMSAPPDAADSVAKPVLSASIHTHHASPAASVDRPETALPIWESFDEHWAQQVLPEPSCANVTC